jgi:hypothetical protein
MAEDKNLLDKIRETASYYDKKATDAINYITPPPLRKIIGGIESLLPFQNRPDATEFIQNPSFKTGLDLLTDTVITGAEVTPLTYLASRGATLPGKVAQEVTAGVKPVDDIINQKIVPKENVKTTDEKIKDLLNKIGSKKAEKAEEILKDLDDETLMLTKPDDIINILNKGGLEGTISSNVAKNIKNLVKKKRGIDEKYFNINFSTEKGTQAKKIFDDIYSGVITQGEGAVKLENLYPNAKLGFVNIGSKRLQKSGKSTVTAKFNEVFKNYMDEFKAGKEPVAEGKVFKAGRFYSDLGPTYDTILKDSTKRYKKDSPKFYKMYDQLDNQNKVAVENFLESALPFFAKGESRSLPMMKMREFVARMYKSDSRKELSDEEVFKQLNNVNMTSLVDVLKKNQVLSNIIKDANEQGITLSKFNLSHIADVSNYWKNTLDANNLYFLEERLNLSDTKNANKQIKKLLEEAKNAKTTEAKNKVTEKFNALGEILENKNLITKVEGQTFGAKNVDSKTSYERIKKNLEKEYSEKDPGIVDYASGGLVGIDRMTRSLREF